MISQTEPGKGAQKHRAFPSPEMAQSLDMQIQALFQEQADFLADTQMAMVAWSKRRQEAMEANFKTFAAMGVSLDPAAMNAAYSEWLKSSMDRILQDLDSVRQEALRAAEIGQKSMNALFLQRGNTAFRLDNEAAPLPSQKAAE